MFAAFRSFGFSCGGDGGEQSVAGEEENDGQTGQNLQRDEHVQTRPIEIHQHEHRAQGQVEHRHVQGAGGEKVNKIIRIKIGKLTKQKRGRICSSELTPALSPSEVSNGFVPRKSLYAGLRLL